MKALGFIGVLVMMGVTMSLAQLDQQPTAALAVAGLAVLAILAAYGIKRPMDALVTLFAPAERLGRTELESARRVLGGAATLTMTAGVAVAVTQYAGAGKAAAAAALFYGLVPGGLLLQALALQTAVRAGEARDGRRFEHDRHHDRERSPERSQPAAQQPRRDQRPASGQSQNQQQSRGGNQPQRQGGSQPAQQNQQPKPNSGSGTAEPRDGRDGRDGRGRNRRNRFRDRDNRERPQPAGSGSMPAASAVSMESRQAVPAASLTSESLDDHRTAAAPSADSTPAPSASVSALLTSTSGTEL
ncbi:MAG TPA: hypothetical protein PKM88_01365 [bacterium]|nr:hypothetical protein [bacterium]